MLKSEIRRDNELIAALFDCSKVLFFVYCFLVSIDLLGTAFKLSGSGFATQIMQATSNPFIGLILGIVSTSILQSSSSTTSIIVAMVGAGALTLENAIPMVMGANIGTTVTCTIVSFGYIGRKTEFERSFKASIVHDIFNISATIILFPLELYTGIIYRSSLYFVGIFTEFGGLEFVSPLKIIVTPVSEFIAGIIGNHYVLIAVALSGMFFSMTKIVENMKGIVMEKVEKVLNRYLFRNALVSMLFGCVFTALIQSSSIATSLIVPIVGAGLLTIEQIFPYMLGANVGTTVTAILAALTIGQSAAIAVSFSHLLFNIFGIALIYPIRIVPITLAKKIGSYVTVSKKHFFIFILIFILLHFIPIILAFI